MPAVARTHGARTGVAAALAMLAIVLGAGWPGAARAVGDSLEVLVPQEVTGTLLVEHQDRVNRLKRLAALAGIAPPEIDEMTAPPDGAPGFSSRLPIARARFAEQVFFDAGQSALRPEAMTVLDVLADDLRRDLPDVKLTIIGHTDASGGDDLNVRLSEDRALSVMQELTRRGVREQMFTIAVGKTQPAYPNSTAEGRARNRRVEFVFSASEDANRLLVTNRRVPCEYLALDGRSGCQQLRGAQLREHQAVVNRQDGKIVLFPLGLVQARPPEHVAQIHGVRPQGADAAADDVPLNEEFVLGR
jgi:outer membrane protein OmpA-like peptidoglycan-associated protein